MYTTYRHWQEFLSAPEVWLQRPPAAWLGILEAARQRVATESRPFANDYVTARGPQRGLPVPTRRLSAEDTVIELAGLLGAGDPFAGEAPLDQRLARYLQVHLEAADLTFLLPHQVAGQWYLPQVLDQVGNAGWIESFLRGKAPKWENRLYVWATGRCLSSPAVMECAQSLLRRLKASPTPIPVRTLVGAVAGTRDETVARALAGLMRYLLAFAGLDPETQEPRFGLWPALSAWFHRPTPVLPPVVEPVEVFHRPLMLDDLGVLLSEVAARPPRLKATTLALYARAAAELEAALPATPSWMTPWVAGPSTRLAEALEQALALNLVRIANDRETGGRRLDPRPGLTEWFAGTAEARLRRLVAVFKPGRSGWDDFGTGRRPLLLPDQPDWYVFPSRRLGDATVAVQRSWGRPPEGGFRPVGGLLDFLARNHNPLLDALEPGETLEADSASGPYFRDLGTDPGRVEQQGHALLRSFLVRRLVPLGGVCLGLAADGSVLCELTEAGRFILGATREFTLPETPAGELVVQPDFEIVFLAPNSQAEAELGRFCARAGRGHGVVLRITRESCLAAARTGLGAAEALALLEKFSSKPVPGNVRHEIQAWFGLARTVKSRRALLFECPDPETALRVTSALRQSARLLNPVTVEFTAGKISPAQRQRLQAAGLFIASGGG